MAQNLKTGDKVMVIAGEFKGKTAEIVKVDRLNGKAMLDGINVRERHLKKSYYNPAGGKKSVHCGIDLSNLKLVQKADKVVKKSADAKKSAKTAKTTKKKGAK